MTHSPRRATRLPAMLRHYITGRVISADGMAHDQQWEMKPKLFDLESNALSTQPLAPSLRWLMKSNMSVGRFC